MKIYNKKRFFSGFVSMGVVLFALISMITNGFSIKLCILTIILTLFCITDLARCFSKTASLEDKISDADERDKYITLKTSHKTLQILMILNLALIFILIITYSITKNNEFLVPLIMASIYNVVSFIIMFITNIYYEKYE